MARSVSYTHLDVYKRQDKKHKVHLLMEYTDRSGEVADPWFTGDFDTTFRDLLDGCRGVLKEIIQEKRSSFIALA